MVKENFTELEEKLSDKGISLERKIIILLKYLGIKQSLSGFTYIREALALGMNNKDYLRYITKLLYPDIAKKFNTTASRVERTIRHAIEIFYADVSSSDDEELKIISKNIFGRNIFKKPNNSEFIAALVNYLEEVKL